MKHLIKEDSRYHVKFWDSNGIHCSEKNCELNQIKKVRTPTNLRFKHFLCFTSNALPFLVGV